MKQSRLERLNRRMTPVQMARRQERIERRRGEPRLEPTPEPMQHWLWAGLNKAFGFARTDRTEPQHAFADAADEI